MGKNGPSKSEWLVEANCTYEERECLSEYDEVGGDVGVHGNGEGIRSARLVEERMARKSQKEEPSQ